MASTKKYLDKAGLNYLWQKIRLNFSDIKHNHDGKYIQAIPATDFPGVGAGTDGDKEEFAMGVQKVGSLNSRWKVYKNPYMLENVILTGYKGSQFLEAGAVYAPYIPLLMTPLVYDPETFTPRKGIMTRYAKKMLRPEFYAKIFVSDLETI